ncbi:flagellar hook protein FlgE [Minwuia thermotolerans]|uniref:Flagellar hook protein FlgE n=1 Tax=Minwuia thermotolerans TaxID=2056226 RepID=A0A2M9FYB4_9PROT|nr:flagellar hook protein FlgE [Minwuia thermotolerans]PJK28452.1 flagellar hook protein FlgE [Minwuia thermotolerans]
MSILGAMFSGVSGLNAQSQAMSSIANNIANVNTVGFKSTRAAFTTLVGQAGTASRGFNAGGVQAQPINLNNSQGLLQQSTSATDIAISGNGFFVVNTTPDDATGEFLFTRAGQFSPDQNGNLRNSAGHYLRGWPIDANGDIPTNRTVLDVTQTVNVNSITGSATATDAISLQANLQSTQTVNAGIGAYAAGDMAAGTFDPDFETTLQLFDSQGGTRSLTIGFLKSATANQWLTEIYVEPAAQVDAATHPNGLISSGTMAFNTDGTLDLTSTSAALQNLNITWDASLGVDNSTVAVDFGSDGATDGMTQFNGISQIISNSINGAVFGSLTGVEIDENGIVTAFFDNGTRQKAFQLPIATFTNNSGLSSVNGNAFQQNNDSGNFSLNVAGVGGAGFIAPSSLESSTVDLAEEFTNMIQTQRAFSANGKIITSVDEMLEELVRLKR